MISVKHQAVDEQASKRQRRGIAVCIWMERMKTGCEEGVESGGGTLVEGSKAAEGLAHKRQ